MMKRMIALVLCLASVLLCLTACSHGENDKGAYIRMYLTEPVNDVDPLKAFDNEATLQIVSLLFEGLFTADENGMPKKALVDDYKYTEDEKEQKYLLTLTLKETYWSDGVQVTATDVQYAFRRLLASDTSHAGAVLLYDIKNARSIAEGNSSVDDLGVTVVNNTIMEIEFDQPIDLDKFLLNLCSPALYPLREDVVGANADWGKKASTIITNGPFLIRSMNYAVRDGFMLERNSYYYRDRTKDNVDKYVKPFRIVVNYLTDPAEQMKLFDAEEVGALYYFGEIPMAVRESAEYAELLSKAKITNAPSTHVYYLNQNAIIDNGGEGEALFAKAEVRKALSLAIDREAIAKALVYASAADALVPHTMLNRPDRKAEFREKAESYIATTANVAEAKQLLSSAGVNPGNYSFSITVAAYDAEHVAMASLIKSAWAAIGFNRVTINALSTYEIKNKQLNETTNIVEEIATGMFANPYREALETGNFEVIALDLVATSSDAFTYLAPFATKFSGNALTIQRDEATGNTTYALTPHITGYSSEAYDAKIEEAYACEDLESRAARLHEAEKLLMEDMAVIPVVYNQNVSLASKKLSGIRSNFFCSANFTKTKLSGYWDIALRDEFVVEEDESDEEAAD